MSEPTNLEGAYQLAEGYLATGQYEAASRVVAALLNYEGAPNHHHLRLLLEEIVEAEPIASALVSLATILLSGDTGETEPERAVGLLQEAIDDGEAPEAVVGLAHELLADCHIAGSGVAADPIAAVQHLRQAAELGRGKAAFNLGLALHQGLLDQGVDLDAAWEHYRRAADLGEARALTHMALIYLEDPAVDKVGDALQLLEQARALGDSEADRILTELDIERPQER